MFFLLAFVFYVMSAASSSFILRPARAGLIADGVRVQSGDGDSDNVAWRAEALEQKKSDYHTECKGLVQMILMGDVQIRI